MIRNIFFFIFHIHVFIKFWITNRRFAKYGYRRFAITLHEERDKKAGGGFIKYSPIVVEAADFEEAYLKLRDEHRDIFLKADHLTYKEII